MTTPIERDEWQAVVEALKRRPKRLTEWDREFLRSVQAKLRDGRHLSGRQIDILGRLYAVSRY